jgi:hypothetical protein
LLADNQSWSSGFPTKDFNIDPNSATQFSILKGLLEDRFQSDRSGQRIDEPASIIKTTFPIILFAGIKPIPEFVKHPQQVALSRQIILFPLDRFFSTSPPGLVTGLDVALDCRSFHFTISGS